jgi:hypothetical protein
MRDVENIAIAPGADGGAVLSVKVVPNASRNKLAGVLGAELKVTVSAPPEKGKANQAVAKVLAEALGLAPRDVTLVSGPSNPRKEFRVPLSSQELRSRLGAL